MAKKQFRTSVLIDDDKAPFDDLAFIKRKGLKPTNLLRAKIKELRKREAGEPSTEQILENLSKFRDKLEKSFAFLGQKGLLEEFLKSEKFK